MSKSFYKRRLVEEQNKLDALMDQATTADEEEFEQLTKDAAYHQHEINLLKQAVEKFE